jgi:hypothetical protein
VNRGFPRIRPSPVSRFRGVVPGARLRTPPSAGRFGAGLMTAPSAPRRSGFSARVRPIRPAPRRAGKPDLRPIRRARKLDRPGGPAVSPIGPSRERFGLTGAGWGNAPDLTGLCPGAGAHASAVFPVSRNSETWETWDAGASGPAGTASRPAGMARSMLARSRRQTGRDARMRRRSPWMARKTCLFFVPSMPSMPSMGLRHQVPVGRGVSRAGREVGRAFQPDAGRNGTDGVGLESPTYEDAGPPTPRRATPPGGRTRPRSGGSPRAGR